MRRIIDFVRKQIGSESTGGTSEESKVQASADIPSPNQDVVILDSVPAGEQQPQDVVDHDAKTEELPEEPFTLMAQMADKLEVTEIDGVSLGEFSSVEGGETSDNFEVHIQTRQGSVNAITNEGGEHSKYSANEDALAVVALPEQITVVVIDGAGGSGNGRLAATIATAVTERLAREGKGVEDILKSVDKTVTENAQAGYACGVIIQIGSKENAREVTLGYSGDSKVMTIRANAKLAEGTTPYQNFAEAMIATGNIKPEEYYTFPMLNTITGGLGGGQLPPETKKFEGQAGDVMVAASDGFWDNVSEYEILKLWQESSSAAEFQNKLYALALERNNATQPFTIQHSEDIAVEKLLNKVHQGQLKDAGDNVTIAVVEMK